MRNIDVCECGHGIESHRPASVFGAQGCKALTGTADDPECCGCTWSPAQLIATYGRAMKAERDAALAEIARLRAAVEAVLADHFADSGGQWKEIRAEAIRAALTPGTEQ